MQWFLDLTMRAKLLISFSVMLLLLAAVSVIAYRSLTAIRDSQAQLYAVDFADAVDFSDLSSNENGLRAAMLTMMVVTTRSEQDTWRQDATVRGREIETVLQGLLKRHQNDPAMLRRLEGLSALQAAYTQTRETEIIPLIYARKTKEATTLLLGIQAERYGRLRAMTDELAKQADAKAQAAVVQAGQSVKDTLRLLSFAGFVALVVGLVTAISMNRAIGEVTRELQQGVSVLAGSASEILATTTQVASGATETATAVGETTTTVEEVKQTAHVASQKAKYVSETAQKAAQVAQGGRKAVGDTIDVMNQIREQMQSVAESIVRLSDQSQAIGAITATVSDLAEQSNLLAVNAAIEAAKAGEHGKGFAVVAQEVKSLAEQSKQATGQVRTILSDIQKATAAAVMATEQGSKAVASGVKQSTDAGESIRVLTESIAEAAQAATQIAASSQQQLVGMDQVAVAMENIKQATGQNVTSTQQTEIAARNLHELGQKLKYLAARY